MSGVEQAPAVAVRIYRDGHLETTTDVETMDEALALVEEYDDDPGVEAVIEAFEDVVDISDDAFSHGEPEVNQDQGAF